MSIYANDPREENPDEGNDAQSGSTDGSIQANAPTNAATLSSGVGVSTASASAASHHSVAQDLEERFLKLLHEIGNTAVIGEKFASRELSIAATKVQEAVMWAKREIYKPKK